MTEEIKENSNCIIKAFENNNITIIKEYNNTYLFKANDIGKILDLTNIRVSIQNFDEDEKCIRLAYTVRGEKDMIFLTSRGIYRLLYNSKKPIAKQFRKWIGDILDDLIFNQGVELKTQLEKYHLQINEKNLQYIKDKQNILLNSYHLKCIVYLIKIIINDVILYKFGYTDNIKRRLNEHQREINDDIELVYCIESKNNNLLENELKEYLKIANFRKEQIINDKNQTELIEIDDISIIQIELEKMNKYINENKEYIIIKRLELENENLRLKLQLNKEQTVQEIQEHYDIEKDLNEINDLPENTKEQVVNKITKLQDLKIKQRLQNNKRMKKYRESEKYKEYLQSTEYKEKERLRYQRRNKTQAFKQSKQEYYKNNKEKIDNVKNIWRVKRLKTTLAKKDEEKVKFNNWLKINIKQQNNARLQWKELINKYMAPDNLEYKTSSTISSIYKNYFIEYCSIVYPNSIVKYTQYKINNKSCNGFKNFSLEFIVL